MDYELRAALPSKVEQIEDVSGVRNLVESKEDGRIKLFVTYRTLNFRHQHRTLFEKGAYIPLEASGERSENICAFSRDQNGEKP